MENGVPHETPTVCTWVDDLGCQPFSECSSATPADLSSFGALPVGNEPKNGPKIDIDALRARLWKALVSDPDCMAFLGINGAVSILSLVDSIPIDVETYFDRDLGAATSLSLTLDNPAPQNPAIHINSNGPFFPGRGRTTQGLSGSLQMQATIMFHELAHASNAIPQDGYSSNQSMKNTDTVQEKCKNAISNFAGK
jgi:hypothetical protein